MGITVRQYQEALQSLEEIQALIHTNAVGPAVQRHFDSAVELLVGAREREWHIIEPQRIRNELLLVRELLGDEYSKIPAPDRLIRFCDAALAAVPGEGQPSQVPYE